MALALSIDGNGCERTLAKRGTQQSSYESNIESHLSDRADAVGWIRSISASRTVCYTIYSQIVLAQMNWHHQKQWPNITKTVPKTNPLHTTAVCLCSANIYQAHASIIYWWGWFIIIQMNFKGTYRYIEALRLPAEWQSTASAISSVQSA